MKAVLLSLLILVFIGVKAQVNDNNKHVRVTLLTNKNRVNIIDGKPISFFLNHHGIDSNSKKFYQGALGVYDDIILNGIMDSLTSCNPEIRPFYFFIFNQIVDLSNEKRVEAVAIKCKEFVEKYPCEFFNSFNQPELNINVVKWTNYIGITLKDRVSYAVFRNNVDSKINAKCPNIQDLLKSFMVEVRMCLLR